MKCSKHIGKLRAGECFFHPSARPWWISTLIPWVLLSPTHMICSGDIVSLLLLCVFCFVSAQVSGKGSATPTKKCFVLSLTTQAPFSSGKPGSYRGFSCTLECRKCHTFLLWFAFFLWRCGEDGDTSVISFKAWQGGHFQSGLSLTTVKFYQEAAFKWPW